MQEEKVDEKILANHDWNEERTTAFITTKQKRSSDSISWLIWGLIILFFSIFSLCRITIIGQFLDDVIFNFLFGWFKYVIYLLLFFIDICIFAGVRFKFKKRFLSMVICWFALMCWFISLAMYAYYIKNNVMSINGLWQDDIFSAMIKNYSLSWFELSIFKSGFFTQPMDYVIKTDINGYFNLNSAGGILGQMLAGLSGYLSIVGAYLLWVFMVFISGMWVLTGDPLYFFKNKRKRKGRALRILSLKAKKNPNQKPEFKEAHKQIEPPKKVEHTINPWESINVFGQEEINIDDQVKTSDLTIQMPSYFKNEQRIYLDNMQREQEMLILSKANEVTQQQKEQVQNVVSEQNNNSNVMPESQQVKIDAGGSPKPRFVSRRPTFDGEKKYNKIPDTSVYSSSISKDKIEENEVKIQSGEMNESIKPTSIELTNDLSTNVSLNEEKSIDLENEVVGDDTFFNSIYEDRNFQAHDVTLDDNDIVQLDEDEDFNPSEVTKGSQQQGDSPESATEIQNIENKKPYKLPPIDLLVDIDRDYEKERANKETAALKALAIDETFNQFGIKAKVVNSIIGPSIMKFEIQTAPGTKVNSITNLENDLRLALATNNMRMETPIPGKTLIGIEIANSFSEMVSMREIIQAIPESQKDEKLLFVLGKNVLGQPLTAQLNRMPHLLIAGSTGSGKSVMVNTIICSILLRAKPSEVRFIMIDPKRVELAIYSKIPHMLAPVISDMKQAASALKMVVMEMDRRYELFMSIGVRNIDGFNKKAPNSKKLPYYVVIIDELADLMMAGDKKAVEESIMRITQMARAAGIHLIVATQRPSVDVITGTIKTNIPTRIAFAVTTGTDSRTIIDSIGAENLLGRGDMLFMPPNGGGLIRAQGAYMSDEEIEEIVDFVINQKQVEYSEQFSDDIMSNLGSKDEIFPFVKEFVLSRDSITTSELKGRFNLGDSRAVNILSQLEEEGIIGPKNGSKPREVLQTKKE